MFAPTDPENAKIVERLTDALTAVPIGGILDYATASDLAGRDVHGRYRYLMSSAREKAEKQLGCIFAVVRNVGIKRVEDAFAPEVGLTSIRRVRRIAKRGTKRLRRLNGNSLSESEHRRVISYSSMLGAIAMMADGNKVRTISAVIDPAKPIPPENILKMFMK